MVFSKFYGENSIADSVFLAFSNLMPTVVDLTFLVFRQKKIKPTGMGLPVSIENNFKSHPFNQYTVKPDQEIFSSSRLTNHR